MKANELMIGDWVNTPKGNYQIDCIQDNDVVGTTYNNGEGVESLFRINKIEPILITPEILEKNGFEVTRNMSSSGNKDVWSLRVSKNKVFHIIEHHNKRKFPYFWIELGSNSDIKYVHELQHALRLCEIKKEIIL